VGGGPEPCVLGVGSVRKAEPGGVIAPDVEIGVGVYQGADLGRACLGKGRWHTHPIARLRQYLHPCSGGAYHTALTGEQERRAVVSVVVPVAEASAVVLGLLPGVVEACAFIRDLDQSRLPSASVDMVHPSARVEEEDERSFGENWQVLVPTVGVRNVPG